VDQGWRLERDLFPDDCIEQHPAPLGLNGFLLRREIVVHLLDRLFGHSTPFGSSACFR
jgi:hypothetical protein